MTATISLEKKRKLYELRKKIRKEHYKDVLIDILEKRGGREKKTVMFYLLVLNGLRSYSEFIDIIVELEEENRLQIEEDWNYLCLIV